MSIIKFPSRKLNKKKMIISISVCALFFIFLIISIIYFFNSSFRAFIDINILRKEIKSDNLAYIEVLPDEDQYFYAYDKYIVSLNKNMLYTYSNTGQVISKTEVNVTSPIWASNNKYLLIAQNNGKNIYLVSGNNILWQNTIDGNISKININKNGYVSLIVSGTSYKSIVISFDLNGDELFKTYLSNSIAIDTAISNDNKYLSIAELDYSGSLIKSLVKNISIEKAKTDPTNSIIYVFNSTENNLIKNIKCQDKNKLICTYDNSIHLINISDSTDSKILSFENNYEFVDINLKNSLIYTFNKNHGFVNNSCTNILNIQNNSLNSYEFKGTIKSIYSYEEKIAINTGSEIHFIGLNGWLIKKYNSSNEINNIVLGDTVAGIIYKDKIKIIDI